MSYNIDPSMAANSAAQQDIDARRRTVESLSGNADPAQKQAKLRSACEGFEAVFIQKMWEQMRASLPKEGLMKGKEEEYWQSMYDQELGKSMASSGGIGLADMMMVQLTRNDQEMSDATKGSTMRRPELSVSPAPLLPPSANVEHKVDTPAVAAKPVAAANTAVQPAAPAGPMSIYDGAASPEAPLAPEGDNNGNTTPNGNGTTPMPNDAAPTANAASPVALVSAAAPVTTPVTPLVAPLAADDTPASVRQTLDEISHQLGVPSPTAGASAVTEPTVTHVTYQTNLPPSQRKADPSKQRNSSTPVQPRPLNTAPVGMAGAASAMGVPGNVPGYTAPTPPNTPTAPQAVPQTPVAQSAPQMLVAQATQREPEDILAGITPRFIPTRFQARNTGAAATEAISIARQNSRLTENPDGTALISQTGGPSLAAPEEVAAPVAMGSPEPPRGSLSAPVSGELSSGFGWRIDPFTGQRAWHAGVDIKAQPGEGVRAAKDGVVTFAGTHPELGNLVVVDHGDGLRTFYGHNQELEVSVGQRISSGTELARAGSSGRAAGTHVHFEVRRGELALNPEPLLGQPRLQVAEAN